LLPKKFEQNNFNPNTPWKLINELLNKTKPSNNISMLQPEGSSQPADQHSIPNMFNENFTQLL